MTNLCHLDEPLLGGGGVGDCFLGGECLGGDDEENSFRVDALQHFRQMTTVNVRDEVNVRTHLRVDRKID